MNRFAVGVSLAVVVACNTASPPRGPEETCARSCAEHAGRCSEHECWRGCNLVLDRLAEHEGDRVVACVAKAKAACDDRAWAFCAVRVGAHADGGPPPPSPPSDFEDVDQE